MLDLPDPYLLFTYLPVSPDDLLLDLPCSCHPSLPRSLGFPGKEKDIDTQIKPRDFPIPSLLNWIFCPSHSPLPLFNKPVVCIALTSVSRVSADSGDVGAVWQFLFNVFWPRDSTIFCNSPAVVLGEFLATRTLLLTVHYDEIDTRPLPGTFVTFYVDWKFLIIALMMKMGNFSVLSTFLKPTSLICKSSIIFFCTSEIYYLVFSLGWMIKGIWALFSLLFIFLWNRKLWLDNFVFIITLECSKLWF